MVIATAAATPPPTTTVPRRTLVRQLPGLTTIFERIRDQDGPVSMVRLGPERVVPPFVFVTGPAGAADVLSARSDGVDKGARAHEEFERLLGASSFSMRTEPWQPRRRIVQPIMTRAHINAFTAHMHGAATDRIALWPADGEIEVVSESRGIALDVLGRSLFALDLASRADTITPALDASLRRVTRRAIMRPAWFSAVGPRTARDIRRLRTVLDEAIDKALARREERDGSAAAGAELVDLLLDAADPETGQHLAREEVRDELMTFLGAGHDTTATTLAATLWLLARHPEVQDRVRDEVDRLGDAPIDAAAAKSLVYTAQVLQESMRLYSPAAAVGRTCTTDTMIGGYEVKAGWQLVVSIWAIHRDPEVWPDPRRFDPERFDSVAKDRDRWAYLPFGAGPRSCPGDHFAMLETTIAIAAVVRAFELSTQVEDLPLTAPFTLNVKAPVPLTVRRR